MKVTKSTTYLRLFEILQFLNIFFSDIQWRNAFTKKKKQKCDYARLIIWQLLSYLNKGVSLIILDISIIV